MKTPRVTSPINDGRGLMQERLRHRPWALLVGCVLYNMVHGERAWLILSTLLTRWPEPADLVAEHRRQPFGVEEELERMLTPLGLQRVRARRVVDLTYAWHASSVDVVSGRVRVESLPGCGRYAAESFELFVKGRLMSRSVDKELRRYIRWARSMQ